VCGDGCVADAGLAAKFSVTLDDADNDDADADECETGISRIRCPLPLGCSRANLRRAEYARQCCRMMRAARRC
jgi:hypothetical protein